MDANRAYAQVLEEWTNGVLETEYPHGHDLISQALAGEQSFYHYDGHGNTSALTNLAGVVTDTYHYEAYGTQIVGTGNTPTAYRYTGEQLDKDLGFYYL